MVEFEPETVDPLAGSNVIGFGEPEERQPVSVVGIAGIFVACAALPENVLPEYRRYPRKITERSATREGLTQAFLRLSRCPLPLVRERS
jgi:hypothetical protein